VGVNGGIVHHDRVFIAGRTGSGKSELINVLFSGFACQRLLVDTKDEFDIPGVERVRDVAAIDWSEPIIHYVDSSSQAGEFDELFEACLRRRHLVVAVHELAERRAPSTPTSRRAARTASASSAAANAR
jgi:energy-coupling factor transporter ATP-binding protein EcfA2